MFEWKKYRFSENGQVPPFSCDATQLIKGFWRSPVKKFSPKPPFKKTYIKELHIFYLSGAYDLGEGFV